MSIIDNLVGFIVAASLLWEMWSNRKLKKVIDAVLLENARLNMELERGAEG